MAFLGGFLLGQVVAFTVTWSPAPGEPSIAGSDLTLTHNDGTIIGPITAQEDATNVWTALAEPTKKGSWRVSWGSTPEGGITHDTIYVS
jgi:hypothetical protein